MDYSLVPTNVLFPPPGQMNYDHEGPHWHWDGPPPPKTVLTWDGPKANVLVGCSGSSAADKLPALVEELQATGKFNVKVVPSANSKNFFQVCPLNLTLTLPNLKFF
jgi:hypothetical protein